MFQYNFFLIFTLPTDAVNFNDKNSTRNTDGGIFIEINFQHTTQHYTHRTKNKPQNIDSKHKRHTHTLIAPTKQRYPVAPSTAVVSEFATIECNRIRDAPRISSELKCIRRNYASSPRTTCAISSRPTEPPLTAIMESPWPINSQP